MSRENGLRGVGTKDRGRVLALGVAARFRALVARLRTHPARGRPILVAIPCFKYSRGEKVALEP
jgi:hypothetical protein